MPPSSRNSAILGSRSRSEPPVKDSRDKSPREDEDDNDGREEETAEDATSNVEEEEEEEEEEEDQDEDEDADAGASSSSTNPLDLKAKEREARFKALRARAVCHHPRFPFLIPLISTPPTNFSRKTPPLPISKKSMPSAGVNPQTPGPSLAYNASAQRLNSNSPNPKSLNLAATLSANALGTGRPKNLLSGTKNLLKSPATAKMLPSKTTPKPRGSSTKSSCERWARRT